MGERDKSKSVPMRLINPTKEQGPYRVLTQVIESHCDDLRGARVALYWREGWREDAHGNLKHTTTTRRNDKERQVAKYDIAVEINRELWTSLPEDSPVRHALLYHALCRVYRKKDKQGEPKVDEIGNAVYGERHEDIKEFSDVVAVFGSYHERLAHFVDAAKRGEAKPDATPAAAPESKPPPRRRNRAKAAIA